jgi:kynurenine 3-monooxygenase
MPFEGEPSFETLRTGSDVRSFFKKFFPDVVSLVPGLEEAFFRHPPNPMVSVRCSPWTYQGQVALIGDAAHVLFPYYGQGANAGFEDCLTLVECLDRNEEDWPAALREYEQLRKPNMNAIADMCVEHYIEIRDLLGDPTFLLRKTLERKVNQMYPTQYLPLYTMIAFSCMPYVEALRIDRRQHLIIDQLMSVDGIGSKVDSTEVEALIHKLMLSALESSPPPAAEPRQATGLAINPFQLAGSM